VESKCTYPVIVSSLDNQHQYFEKVDLTKILKDSPPCADHNLMVLSLEPVATNFPGSALVFCRKDQEREKRAGTIFGV
jgi:hypothetical protein